MANWNDPQSNRTGFGASTGLNGGSLGQAAAYDMGLRSYMLSIYNYMASGILLSGIVALFTAQSGLANQIFSGPVAWLVILAPVGLVFAFRGYEQKQTSTLQMMFWGFSFLQGLSLSVIFLIYKGPSIASTFFATAGAFAGLSLVGYTTKKNLSAMGSFLIMGVWGIIIASLINVFFMKSSALQLAISVLGVLIFAGLTAWDTQRLKQTYAQVAGSEMVGKVVIMGALSLYLDFINLFMFLLRFMGDRR